MAALDPKHSGGRAVLYDQAAREHIIRQARRQPTPEADGTALWSLTTLQKVLRSAPDGRPRVSTHTIGKVVHKAGASPQKTRSWCPTGTILRQRKDGIAVVTDPDTSSKKSGSRTPTSPARRSGCRSGAPTRPGRSRPSLTKAPRGVPRGIRIVSRTSPSVTARRGTAKVIILFHPADGQARVKGVTACPNPVLHGWLKEELTAILAALPTPPAVVTGDAAPLRSAWERWQEGLSIKPTLAGELPPLRMLLVMDNLAGHKTLAFVLCLLSMGVMPLDMPLGGSWLNMVERLQRILKRRALDGQ